MKKLAMALMSLLSLVFCASCSSEIEGLESGSATVQKQENKIRTKLNLTGEMLDVSTAPWTRSEDGEAKDWYAIQVCQTDSTVVTDTLKNGSTKTYVSKRTSTPYAYGLFDDVSNLELDLVEGKTYMIEAVMVKEAADSVKDLGYYKDSKFCYLYEPTNSFVLATNSSFSYYSSNSSNFMRYNFNYFVRTNGNGYYGRPHLEEFSGCISGYNPKEGSSASISMKRCSFCVKLKANDFTEGTITAKIKLSPDITMTPDQTEVQKVISFYDLSVEQEPINVQIIWTKPDGSNITLGSKDITFQRNTITTISFSVNSSTTTQKQLAISVLNEEWQEGKTIDIN